MQSRKKPFKESHGNVLPNDTTYVIEDLSTPERPLYTKQLIEADHGVTWQYALQPHPRSLHRRLQLYSAPSPLYHLAARTAYTALCNTHSTLVLPFVERFRQDLQNSAFFAALLHLDVKLTVSSGSRDNDHSPTPTLFASTQDILDCPLLLSFTDSVPLNNQVISPTMYAAVSQAESTSDFKDLGGTAEHLDYLLHHGHVDIAAADDSDSSDLPANVQATLQSGSTSLATNCSAVLTPHKIFDILVALNTSSSTSSDTIICCWTLTPQISCLKLMPQLPHSTMLHRYDSPVLTRNNVNKAFTCITTRWTRLLRNVCSLHRHLIRASLLRPALNQQLRLHNSTRQSSSSWARMLISMHSRIKSGKNMT